MRNLLRFAPAVLALIIPTCTSQAQAPVATTTSQPATKPHLIAYLFAGHHSNYTDLVKTIQFGKITDLDLAFANPAKCQAICTATSDMQFAIDGETNADIDTIVRAAHTAGVRVMVSIGGAEGDQRIIQFYNAGLSAPVVASLQAFVSAHNLDGVDLDIEDPSNMGAPYLSFVTALTSALHPATKTVTAAVARYLQGSMPAAALRQFDLVNVMVYSSYSAAVSTLDFYANEQKIPVSRLILGVPFFGQTEDDSREEDYRAILSAYPNAWKVDLAAGGALDDGLAFHYVGEATMAQETQLGKRYGGVMFWALTNDAPAPHSLLQVIQTNF